MSELAVRINKILNIILLLVIACLIGNMNDSEDEPEYGVRKTNYDIKPISVEEVEMTEERKELFSDYALDETYGKKVMYLIEMEVNNKDSEGINAYEFDYIIVRSPEGHIFENEMVEYYTYGEHYDMPYTEILPAYSTRKAYYYVVMEEDEVPEEIYIYKSYEEEEYITVEMP